MEAVGRNTHPRIGAGDETLLPAGAEKEDKAQNGWYQKSLLHPSKNTQKADKAMIKLSTGISQGSQTKFQTRRLEQYLSASFQGGARGYNIVHQQNMATSQGIRVG